MIYLTSEEMEKLTTLRLLAYKRKHLATPYLSICVNAFARCKDGCNKCEHQDETVRYSKAYADIKYVLSTRENVK